jgi:hypothetical protein
MTDHACLICGEKITNSEEAAPLTVEGAPLMTRDGPAWAHRQCFEPRALRDMDPATQTRQ